MYESKVLDQTFARPAHHFQDSWHDYGLNFASDFMFPVAHQEVASHAAGRPNSQLEQYSQTGDNSVPPEGLVCKWHDEITGYTASCNYSSGTDRFTDMYQNLQHTLHISRRLPQPRQRTHVDIGRDARRKP